MDEPEKILENNNILVKPSRRRITFMLLAVFGIILMFIIVYVAFSGSSSKLIAKDVEMPNAKYSKVLVIGIDGFDPKIMSQLMAEGKLPNFKNLAKRGTFANLNTSYPPDSPVAWTSIATGENPAKHNIFDYIRRDPKTYLPELSLSKTVNGIAGTTHESFIKADPFWRLATNAGVLTTVMRWPVTFPPEKVNGNLLSGLGVPDVRGLLSGYSFYTDGELSVADKANDKVIQVIPSENVITADILGPKKRTMSNNIVDTKLQMNITLSNTSAVLKVSGKEYAVNKGEWSDWIHVSFKAGLFNNVHGIFKAYLNNTAPFELYTTTIQIDPQNPLEPISSPADYSTKLANDIGDYYTLGMPEETAGVIDGKLSDEALLQQIDQIETERTAMFWKEFNTFKNQKSGLFAFVFDSSDRVQHMFWENKVLDGKNKSSKITLSPAIENYYIGKDKFIGQVLENVNNGTLVLIVSDHGFTSFEKAVSINTWMAENGFMTLTKDIVPNDEGALFQYVDWNKTEAYSVGFNSIYVNVKGREAQGIVEDREAVVDRIINALENLTDADGHKVINKAYRREEVYNGSFMNDTPDIIIGFNPGYRMSWQTAIGGFSKEIIFDNEKKWRGDHLIDPTFVPGILFSNVNLGNRTSASQMDIAPTVLDALGIKIPKDVDGKSLL